MGDRGLDQEVFAGERLSEHRERSPDVYLLALSAVARRAESRAQVHEQSGHRLRARRARRSGARVRRLIVKQALAAELETLQPGPGWVEPAPYLPDPSDRQVPSDQHEDEYDTLEIPIVTLPAEVVGGPVGEGTLPERVEPPATSPHAQVDQSALVASSGLESVALVAPLEEVFPGARTLLLDRISAYDGARSSPDRSLV